MRIGIVGSGLLGGKLGTVLARAGHDVTFSYARTREKLAGLAQAAGGAARAGSVREAVHAAQAVLLAVHWSRLEDVLGQSGDLSGKLLVNCSLPMNADDTELLIAHSSSGSEALARRVPEAQVVAAFGTVPSEVLLPVYAARQRTLRPSLVYCGDAVEPKRIVARLIRDIGFEPVDAGPLRSARFTEPFALLVARLAYEGGSDPQLAYRFEQLPGAPPA